jgi:hypothetical protein
VDKYVHEIINAMNDEIYKHISDSFPQIYSFGDDTAEEKTNTIHEINKKYSLENTLFRKTAKSTDRHKLDIEHRRSNLGGKIKTLSDDIKQQIIDGINNHVNASPLMKDIIRQQRDKYDDELAKTTDKKLRDEIKQKIKHLYTKQQYKVERAVRTEAMNAASRAQLLRYEQMNVKEVSLQTSHDIRVCAKCRLLEKSKKVWDVSKLLLLGAYPLTTLTHPQCRCTFSAVINEIEYDNNIGEIKNIPRNETKNVQRLAKEIQFTTPIEFVTDITEHPEFKKSRTRYYERKGESPAKASLLADNDKEKFRGKITTLTVGSGKDQKVLLDSQSDKNDRFTYLLSRIQARQVWGKADSKDKLIPDMKKMFKEKHFDRHNVTTHKKLFFSNQARSTTKEYFCEAYAHFVVHPQVLKEVDPEMFDYLKYNIFYGRDFLKHNF